MLLFKAMHIMVECFSYILIPFLCISLGHLRRKHRRETGLFLLAFYAMINYTVQVITPLSTIGASLPTTEREFYFAAPTTDSLQLYIVYLIIGMTVNVLAFFVIRYIVTKRLNLE